MQKTLKGSVDYTIELSETEYQLNYTQNPENELAAVMICREILKYNKANLLKSLEQAKGRDLLKVKDRLKKVSEAEYLHKILCESIVGEILFNEEPKVSEVKPEGEVAQ